MAGVLRVVFAHVVWMAVLPAAAADTASLTGRAYDLKSNQLLYKEVHEVQQQDGRIRTGVTRYYDPQGKLFATKSLDYGPDYFIPVYRLDIQDQGYFESLAFEGDGLVLTRNDKRLGERRKKLKHAQPMAADSGVLHFVWEQFPVLLAGNPVKLKLAVANRLDTVSVRMRRIEDSQIEGRAATNIQIEHDSPLRLLLQPIVLSFDPERQLLGYRGTSNIIDPKSGDPYEVRIAYDPPATGQ